MSHGRPTPGCSDGRAGGVYSIVLDKRFRMICRIRRGLDAIADMSRDAYKFIS